MQTDLPIVPTHLLNPPSRQPDRFYHKDGRASEPVQSFELTCEQWRHRDDAEYFPETQICFDLAKSAHAGKIGLSIFAENLPKPVRKFIAVEVAVEETNLLDHAMEIIQDLQMNPKAG